MKIITKYCKINEIISQLYETILGKQKFASFYGSQVNMLLKRSKEIIDQTNHIDKVLWQGFTSQALRETKQ